MTSETIMIALTGLSSAGALVVTYISLRVHKQNRVLVSMCNGYSAAIEAQTRRAKETFGKLQSARATLARIRRMETPGANATVRRMARAAKVELETRQ